MKFPLLSTLLLTLPLAMADEIQMQDGKIYKHCTIESETATDVSFMVEISKGIKDSLKVPKAQVKAILKSTPDELACDKIVQKYSKGELGESPAAEVVNKGIKDCEEFVAKFAKSKKLAEVEGIAGELKSIKKTMDDATASKIAEEKANEPTPEELMKGRYDIEANKLLSAMKGKAKSGNAIGAMQSYEALKEGYRASQAYLEGTNMAMKLLPQLTTNLGVMIKTAETKQAAEEKAQETARLQERKLMDKMTEEQKSVIKQRAQDKRNLEREKRDKYRQFRTKLNEKKIRWFSPDPNFIESLQDLQRVAESDLDEVKQELNPEADDSEKGRATAAFKKAWELVGDNKFEEAKDELSIIRGSRVPKEYWSELDAKITAGIIAAKEAEREKRKQEYAKRLEERKKQQDLRRNKSKASLKDLKAEKSPAPKDSKAKPADKPADKATDK
ncbi:MAG: hypothetical protein RR808_01930 [Akkermansia sp.]